MKKNSPQILAYCFYIMYLLGDNDLMDFFSEQNHPISFI